MKISLDDPVRTFVLENGRFKFDSFIDTGSLFNVGKPVIIQDQSVVPFMYKGCTHYLLLNELNGTQQQELKGLASV